MTVIACDDGRVEKLGGGKTLIACLLWSEHGGIERLATLPVHIDGLDATSQVAFMVRILSSQHPVDAILFDSITTAGFNLISPPAISRTGRAPVIVLYKRRPRTDRILRAAREHLPDYRIRSPLLRLTGSAVPLETRRGTLYAILWGIDPEGARAIVEKYQVHSRVPEPLRAAHLFASALSMVLIRQ